MGMTMSEKILALEYKPGDIFVAERNLGSGSNRKTAPRWSDSLSGTLAERTRRQIEASEERMA